MITVEGTCMMCKRKTYLDLTEEETDGYIAYQETGALIQKCMPNADPAVREYVRDFSGRLCSDCMEKLFGHGCDRIKVC